MVSPFRFVYTADVLDIVHDTGSVALDSRLVSGYLVQQLLVIGIFRNIQLILRDADFLHGTFDSQLVHIFVVFLRLGNLIRTSIFRRCLLLRLRSRLGRLYRGIVYRLGRLLLHHLCKL